MSNLTYYFSIFTVSLFCCSHVQAQQNSFTIPVAQGTQGQASIEGTFRSVPLSLELTNGKKQVRLTANELVLFQQRNLNFPFTLDTLQVNGKQEVNLNFVMDSLFFDCILLLDVPTTIAYTIPQNDYRIKPTISTGLLSNVGVYSKQKGIITIKNPSLSAVNPSCRTANASLDLTSIRSIKLIPCSTTTAITTKKDQLMQLFTTAGSQTVEEEQQVPPRQKAVSRVKAGITIRYFSTQDQATAQVVQQHLKQQYPGDSIYLENMLSAFNNTPIPQYLEIWIK